PLPNPLSWWLHFRPHWFHQLGALWNHVVELIVPWFAFWPRLARHIAGALLVSFQISLILSGNLSFLNWLTIVPAVACFDDSLLRKVLPRWLTARVPLGTPASWPAFSFGGSHAGKDAGAPKYGILESLGLERRSPYDIAAMVLTVLVALLSIAPVANMLSPNQVMNTSFNRLHLVNT